MNTIITRPLSLYETEVYGRWQKMQLTTMPLNLQAIHSVAEKIKENQVRYLAAGLPLGIPFEVVGCLHYRESSLDFSKHLHNGDPLSARTTHVPAGRPTIGNPPFTWEHSARDALALRFGKVEWDLVNSLVRMESYNGFGYRKRLGVSPYIWSFTDQYSKGKFSADGFYDSTLVDRQPGCAAILKVLLS